jgi:hypothetical protein
MANVLSEWYETTDILHGALVAEDEDGAFEALTILLMQLVDHAGATHPTVMKFMPTRLDIKEKIQSGRLRECIPRVVEIKELFRAARDDS